MKEHNSTEVSGITDCGNKLTRTKKSLFPIKAKTLMQLDFKGNAQRKNPLLLL